jgi:radical SAM superfamily enzyme YgiQ (UPF0313 family)
MARRAENAKFFVEIIKPSHYDDEGYVIQWFRAFIASNSLACVYALVCDARSRKVLGENVEIVVNAYEECHTIVPTKKIIRRIQRNQGRGLVMLVGVQSNQFPRAADFARDFRQAGIPVAIGGFHVSGSLAMLSQVPEEIKAVQELGVTLFAGEAEGRMEGLLRDAYAGAMKPVYNYLGDLPSLQGHPTPLLPLEVSRKYVYFAPFDAGRGCPFDCSFCTIINVQGRKSRFRGADDVERVVRANLAHGARRFFITDDNMARNKNWEAIFDRLIALREDEGIRLKTMIQVDAQAHKIPNFLEKAARAGCTRVFIGLESINAENLRAANKRQNNVGQYRTMLQAWRSHHVLTIGGYILGLPADTPESIDRDIRIIQQELPVDVLEFMILTPLPGSADHKSLYERGVPMKLDMNDYDGQHVTTAHGRMTPEQWQEIYDRAWHLYYTPEHVRTLLRRARAGGAGLHATAGAILSYYGSHRFERLHPMQGGLCRRTVRTTRRPGLPRENPLWFYPRRIGEACAKYLSFARYCLELDRICKQVQRDPLGDAYTDLALTPIGQPRVVEEGYALRRAA